MKKRPWSQGVNHDGASPAIQIGSKRMPIDRLLPACKKHQPCLPHIGSRGMMVFLFAPHGNYYPHGEAFFAFVRSLRESLARFGPPGDRRGDPCRGSARCWSGCRCRSGARCLPCLLQVPVAGYFRLAVRRLYLSDLVAERVKLNF